MSVYATIKDTVICAGGQGLLAPQTTLLTVVLPRLSLHWPQVEPELRAQMPQLLPGDVMMDLGPQGWPNALLAEPVPFNLTFAHWVAALCVVFQRCAGDPVWQGQVLWVDEDSARLAVPWIRTAVLDGAVKLALRHVMIHYEPAHERAEKEAALAHDLKLWLQSVQAGGLSPNSMGLALAACRRGIPVRVRTGFVQLGWGCQSERLDSTFTGKTSNIASKVARDKTLTKQLLWEAGMPVPEGTVAWNHDQAMAFVRQAAWPVVVKPYNQDGGIAVTPGVYDEAELKTAFDKASNASGGAVIVERHIAGHDHRMLVVGGRLMAVTQRTPGGVVGDGQHSVAQLVDLTNQDPRRGREKHSPLIALDMDQEALVCLRQQGFAAETVLAPGQYAYLRRTANISTGGTALHMTALVHPDNRILAERAARVIGLDIAGVDFICPDISRSWTEVGGVICEVNGQPGFRVHRRGAPDLDLFGQVIDWLSHQKNLRIPTAAITGTNGKTTVARMLHHLWVSAGKVAGVTTTQGVWVGREQVSVQNLSGYHGATVLLDDPAVEVAVMELPRKGLIRFGHPCDRYDVAALLNVQDDHIGVDGIYSLEEMARLKGQVLERATQAVVVNAQDPLTLAMLAHAQAPRRILVSGKEDESVLLAHLRQGGEAVFAQVREGAPWIVHAHGVSQTPVMPLHNVPAMMNGLLAFNRHNALFAVALAWAQGLPLSTIREGMTTFVNDEAHNIGRCNFIEGLPFTAVLDYGHNPDGIGQLCGLVKSMPVVGARRLVSLNLANRHRQHFQMTAELLAKTFDHIVLGCDPGYASQNPEYAADDPVKTMLQIGRTHLIQAGIHETALVTEADPVQALRTALGLARPEDALLILAEPGLAIPVIREFKLSAAHHEPTRT